MATSEIKGLEGPLEVLQFMYRNLLFLHAKQNAGLISELSEQGPNYET